MEVLNSVNYFFVNHIYSQEKNFCIGISVFYPTGITLKYRYDQELALESVIGFSRFGRYVHLGLLNEFYKFDPSFSLYLGGSFFLEEKKKKDKIFRGIFIEEKNLYGGIRMPFGFVYYDVKKKFDIFTEISLNVLLYNGVEGYLGLAIGLRVYI